MFKSSFLLLPLISFRFFRCCYLFWVRFYVNDVNLSLKTLVLTITWHSARGELSRVGETKCLYEKKVARYTGLRYLQSEWPSIRGQPAPLTNFAFSRVNCSLLFIKKCMGSSVARGGSVWRVTLLLGTTLFHINTYNRIESMFIF